MHNYLFDVQLYAAIRVNADSVAEARQMLADNLDCALANFGAWDDGEPILAEVSPQTEADALVCVEIDGEPQ